MRWPIAALLCLLVPVAVLAQVPANLGTLTCTLAESGEEQAEATPPTQTRAMVCSFKPEGTGPEEEYSGEIRKVGSASALSGKAVLMWVVLGPANAKPAPGLLAQSYVGTTAPPPEAEWEPPVMLVGERNDNFALRPVTDSFAARSSEENAASMVTMVVLKVKSAPA